MAKTVRKAQRKRAFVLSEVRKSPLWSRRLDEFETAFFENVKAFSEGMYRGMKGGEACKRAIDTFFKNNIEAIAAHLFSARPEEFFGLCSKAGGRILLADATAIQSVGCFLRALGISDMVAPLIKGTAKKVLGKKGAEKEADDGKKRTDRSPNRCPYGGRE